MEYLAGKRRSLPARCCRDIARSPRSHENFIAASCGAMNLPAMEKLLADPLLPAVLLAFWLVLEWLALRRLRRDRVRRVRAVDRSR
jgi:hypothetical protein